MITCARLPILIDFLAICSNFRSFFGLTCLYNPPMIKGFSLLDEQFRQSECWSYRVRRRREGDMLIRRVLALFVAVIIVAGASLTLVAQKVDQKQPKRNKQEQQDIEALVKLVD